jgi:4,5-DOPA dioxygenase extradiol
MTASVRAGAAFDALLPLAVARSADHPSWVPSDGSLPALYLSHGAPPLFDDGAWMRELLDWSLTMPKPRAILVVSAHWESAPLSLSASAAATPLVYDFGGFDARYYAMKYETPDASELARKVAALMPDTEPVHEHASRGLDHGAWVPLKVMYPLGDVPVLQLSIPTHDPQKLMELGRRLRPLRDEGVLIMTSGFMTHGLPFMTREMWANKEVPAWSSEFDAWAWESITHRDVDSLASYRQAPGMPYAHPSPEHFTPLFIAMGASDDAAPTSSIDGFTWGFSKRSLTYA